MFQRKTCGSVDATAVPSITFTSNYILVVRVHACMKRRSIEFQKAKAYAEDTKATNSSTLVYELDQIAEDRELENLEMIYELEYKL